MIATGFSSVSRPTTFRGAALLAALLATLAAPTAFPAERVVLGEYFTNLF